MARNQAVAARPPGTGSLLKHRHGSGAESWYGKWRVDGRQVMRVLGPVRNGSRTGLSREQAEAALRAAIAGDSSALTHDSDLVDIAEAGTRYIANRELLGLKPGTLSDYESYLRVHLVPFFGDRSLDTIDADLIES